jgi:UDP-N-acetylmuramoyl-L-alanyl-D-glutamate--2,6-diaminopimelate ligase
VGVTGTNGKTTTTSWIAHALRRMGTPVGRVTTLGFFIDDEPIGVAPTYDGFLQGMSRLHERGGRFAALELTSESLSAGFARAWPCDVGVFTNLTHDHLDAHGTAEHYLASKAQLFVALREGGTAVFNASDPVSELLREVTPPSVRVRSYAVPARGASCMTPDVTASSVSIAWTGTRIDCAWRDGADGVGARAIRVRAIGEVFAENALAAMLGAVAAGVSAEDAAAALASAPVPSGRFERIHERPWVIVDYAHGPDALARTVSTARALSHGRLFVVFGAGGDRDRSKRAPMGEAARPADVVVLTADNPRGEDPAAIARAIAVGLEGHADVRVELDRRAAIELALGEAARDDVVLIAGKGHETGQTVGAEVRPFSDVEVARDALAKRARR